MADEESFSIGDELDEMMAQDGDVHNDDSQSYHEGSQSSSDNLPTEQKGSFFFLFSFFFYF
jgi:hypothetical protein